MYVDKSHSKRDLILLFHNLGIELNDESSKSQITKILESKIKDCKYNDKITNCTELIDYLKTPSKKQRPTTKIKNDIMFKCKKIIKWGKNDYIFDGLYTTKDEPYQDIMFIHLWGDLPSVRRACKFYNQSVYCINHINPVISEEVQSQLNNNKIIKSQTINKLKVRYAPKGEKILVRFD
jgi:hypothetical protein|tara:strand:+ start:295 stop:831 length:537 start_codon:yes stop_codon:yes gene_type:complete